MLWIYQKRLEFLGRRDGKYYRYREQKDYISSSYTTAIEAKNFAYQEQMWRKYNRQTAQLREKQAQLLAQWQNLQPPSYIPEQSVQDMRRNREIRRRVKREQAQRAALYQELYQVYVQLQLKTKDTEKKVGRRRERYVQEIAAYVRGIALYKDCADFHYQRLDFTTIQNGYLKQFAHLDKACQDIMEREGRL